MKFRRKILYKQSDKVGAATRCAQAVLSLYLPNLYTLYRKETEQFLKDVLALKKDRGPRGAVLHCKSSRVAVLRYIAGSPLTELEGVALTSGFPTWLLPFRSILDYKDGAKYLLTLLVALRGIHLTPELDVSSIEAEWKGSVPPLTDVELDTMCRWLGIKSKSVKWSRPHMSTKSGPLGQAMKSSVNEVCLLTPQTRSDLRLLGGEKLDLVLTKLQNLELKAGVASSKLTTVWSLVFPPKGKSLRKLSYFADKEGKTRTVAIVDYWTQSCLKPYHDALSDILRGIKQDVTFNQGDFLQLLLKDSVGRKHRFWSFDLKNATDRMPIVLQKILFAKIFGQPESESWARLLVGAEYSVHGRTPVRYAAGQPMGAYSSWPIMALTHHFIVKWAGLRCGIPNFSEYCILGDDIVICHDAVATEYRQLLRELDMPISEAKTLVSFDTFEFAKRVIHKGDEVTPYAISGIQSVYKRYSLLLNFLDTQQGHGWHLENDEMLPQLVLRLHKILSGPAYVVRRAHVAFYLMQVLSAVHRARDRQDYIGLLSLTLPGAVPAVPDVQKTGGSSATLLSLSQTVKGLIVEAERQIAEKDVGRMRFDLQGVLKEYLAGVKEHVPGLPLRGLLSAQSLEIPLFGVYERMLQSATKKLAGTLEHEGELLYELSGASRFHLTSIFTAKPRVATLLDESRLARAWLQILTIWDQGGRPDLSNIDPVAGRAEMLALLTPVAPSNVASLRVGGALLHLDMGRGPLIGPPKALERPAIKHAGQAPK